jgi:ABC-2 type transport system permease protein
MFERIRQMLIKEFIQVFRDRRMKFVLFVMPTMQLIVIGYAVTTDVKHVPTAVYDLDDSVSSRTLVDRFGASESFDIVAHVTDDRQMRELLDYGKVDVVLRVNHGFGEHLRAGRTAELQLIVDGTDSNTAGIVLGYANRITTAMAREILIRRFTRLQGRFEKPGRLDLRTRAWFNENLESRNFYVPGAIVVIVSVVTLLLTSMAVVREKEIGTMEQIIVSPIRPAEFVLGKTAPFALIGFLDVNLISAIGVFWFEVPIRGSLWMILLAAVIYLITILGIGLLISTVSHTQQQAMMGTFFFFFPAMLLSGFAFPIANMPEVVQWATYLNPLRYFLVILRGIFLKGVGLDILWPQYVALAIMGVVVLWVVSRRFQKTL